MGRKIKLTHSHIQLKHLTLVILSSVFFCFHASAQIYYDAIISNKTLPIKSLLVTPTNDSLDYAVLPLLGGKTLTVEFDILENDSRYLRYEIIHCDRNWRKSNLFDSDYMQKSGELTIDDYENSFNTSVLYVHYRFSFPNDNLKIVLSGNYILQIFDTESNALLLQKRFVVTEQLVELQAEVKRPNIVQYADFYQQLSLQIVPHGFDLSSFDKDLFVCYRQNGRWDKTINNIQPNHISGDGTLVFNDNRNANMLGGAEFHEFNFKNFNYASYPVDYFTKENGKYAAILRLDKIQPAYIYNDNGDLNGKFCIALSQNFDNQTSADYAHILFTLPYFRTAQDTLNPYVFGSFNNWELNAENKMNYNEDKKQYEASILLKQGYYGYTYLFASNDFKTIDMTAIDGSFYQTENDYEIFVYFYDYKIGYDRCVGYKKINSRKQ